MTIAKTVARIAILALVAGSVALPAVPAQAAPILKKQLQITAPIVPEIKVPEGTTLKKKPYPLDFGWCLTDKQIRKGLRNADFSEIDFVTELSKQRVRVEAYYEEDGWYYSMRIYRCSGKVDQIKPLYEDEDYFDIEF